MGKEKEEGQVSGCGNPAKPGKNEKGLLVTPFRRKDLLNKKSKPQTDRTGQTRIEVSPKENIVNAAFKGLRANGLDARKFVLVAPPKVQAMIPEPAAAAPKVRVKAGRKLAMPVQAVEKVTFQNRKFIVAGRKGSTGNVIAVKIGPDYYRVGGKAGQAIRAKLNARRRPR
jgi:hypothetical protein